VRRLWVWALSALFHLFTLLTYTFLFISVYSYVFIFICIISMRNVSTNVFVQIVKNNVLIYLLFFIPWRNSLQWAMASSFTRFLNHTRRRTTVGRTPLDEWSARRRDLYLTTHNTHNRQTSMSPVRFEPAIAPGERQHTHAFDRAATGISN